MIKIILITVWILNFQNLFSSENTNYVSGRVLDLKNFPVPFVKVILQGIETMTDKSGRFKIMNVTTPYDIVIAYQKTSTAVIYKNLNLENPDLILFGVNDSTYTRRAIVTVNFPEIPEGKEATIKFISSDANYCRESYALSGEKSKFIPVRWPYSQNSINGSVIFIMKNNLEFESFNQKSISIFQNSTPFNVTFKDNPLKNISSSYLNVYLPFENYKSVGYSVYADFPAYDRSSELLISMQDGTEIQNRSIIPYKLPLSFRVKINGIVKYNDGSGFTNTTFTIPGTTINLNEESPPELKTPTDKYLGAAGNTEFSYSSGSGTGVYVVRYYSDYPELNFYIVTAEKNVYLNYLSRDEFKQANSIEFKWDVRKYLTYFSVDDFARSKEFKNDIGYKAVLYSSERTFKTGYF